MEKNQKFIVIFVTVVLLLVTLLTVVLVSNNVFLTEDGKLVQEIETNGSYDPNSPGYDRFISSYKYEKQTYFDEYITNMELKVAMTEDDDPLLKYVDETNETYKEITNLRLEYRFGNITTEEFKNKINEYYYNGNPLLKKLIKPLD